MAQLEAQVNYEFEVVVAALQAGRPASFGLRTRSLESMTTVQLDCWRYLYLKRCADVFMAAILLALGFIPGLLIAAAISIGSEGPIFYRETRIGRGGLKFRIWKFRTMCQKTQEEDGSDSGAHDIPSLHWRIHKCPGDPRITRVGGFLRRWSLDELPQLLNVIVGEMSLVGPRPVVAAELPHYGDFEAFYLAATPGLSGLWQVSGRSNVNFATRAMLDAMYVRDWTLTGDIKILLRTIPAVLTRVGAH
jgi:lipopolysaccharide/colanic/teichoic acid biosynthesis glycosyltransferase